MDARKKINVQYTLPYKDIYETFLILMRRGKGVIYQILSVVIISAGIFFLFLLFRNPARIDYSISALLAAFAIIASKCYPQYKARKNALRLSRIKGHYDITIYMQGIIQSKEEPGISLQSDRKARAFETERLFIVRPDANHTYSIPKTALSDSDVLFVRQTLQANLNHFSFVEL